MSEQKSSNTDTIVKIILVFFISLLSFSIGTFVGKKFSDNQHKLAVMEPGKNEAKGTRAKGSSGHDDQDENLSDDQVAALANEFVDEDPHGSSSKAEHTEKADQQDAEPMAEHKTPMNTEEEPSHDEAKANHAESNMAADESEPAHNNPRTTHIERKTANADAKESVKMKKPEPMADAKSEAKVESPTKIPSSVVHDKAVTKAGKFTVQVASFPSESEAQKKVDELKKLSFEAFQRSAQVKGQTWYRVNVGMYSTAKEAQEVKNQVVEKTHMSAIIQQTEE